MMLFSQSFINMKCDYKCVVSLHVYFTQFTPENALIHYKDWYVDPVIFEKRFLNQCKKMIIDLHIVQKQ